MGEFAGNQLDLKPPADGHIRRCKNIIILKVILKF